MKQWKVWAPGPLRRVRIQEKTKLGEYLIVDDLPGLLALVQMDILEIHTWNATFERLDTPDRIVLDVDPGPEVDWVEVVEVARRIRTVLEDLGLQSFLKTTGEKGLHVIVPLRPHAHWTECLELSRAVAKAIEREEPHRYTTSFKKEGRERKVLIDYLRNNRTNTSIAAFSTRERPGAPDRPPLAWTEITTGIRPDAYTVRNIESRLKGLRIDPWEGYGSSGQELTRVMSEALERV